MRKTYIAALASAIPLLVSTAAFAQSTSNAAAANEKPSDYTLQGSTVKPVTNPQAKVASYEISGTSFSGTAKASEVIMTTPVDASAAPFKTESGIYLYPTLFTGFGSNSNVQSSSTNAVSSNFVNIAPELVAELKHKGDRYTALVSVNNTSYGSSSSDNSTSSELNIAGDNYFTSRARAGWSVGQVNGSDPRGSNNRPISAEPDRWHTTSLNGKFVYGAPEAQGRIEVALGNAAKTYDNNRVNTAVADLTTDSFGATVFYRLSSRTQALAEFRNAKTNYASSLATDSNTERRIYGGVTWEATAATTGTIKVGNLAKEFDRPGKNNFNGGSWEIAARWKPLSYSAIDLQTTRTTADATGVGDYNLNTSIDLIWNHSWNRSLSTRFSVGSLDVDFGGTSRKDTTNNLAFSADYAWLRWLKVGVDIATTDNKTNAATGAYKRTVSMVTLNASL
jgi:hypothetical protein